MALADSELDALTALLDIRVVAGDVDFAYELRDKARALTAKRRGRVVDRIELVTEAKDLITDSAAEVVTAALQQFYGTAFLAQGHSNLCIRIKNDVRTIVERNAPLLANLGCVSFG